jgi:hypothetical protein
MRVGQTEHKTNLTPMEQLVLVPWLRLHDMVYRKTNGRSDIG